jgi:dTDP-4-dehydrorhamnose 3,5-epimerase
MKYTPTEIEGVLIVDLEPRWDERGMFTRFFDAEEMAEQGIPEFVQGNQSFNHKAGTIRGLHRQFPPNAEGKLVRCVAGAIVDVAVDVRPGSPTNGKTVMVELSAENRRALYLPPYMAHGYQTLVDNTEVMYQVTGRYAPGGEEGFRYDDPAFALEWPLPVSEISDKDANAALMSDRVVE